MSIEQILAQRGKTHGEFKDQAQCAQELKEVWHRWAESCGNGGHSVADEAVDMIMHKLARAATGALLEPDHWLDIQGYAKLVSDRIPTTTPPKLKPFDPTKVEQLHSPD